MLLLCKAAVSQPSEGKDTDFFLNEQKFSLLFRCYRLAVWGFCRNFAAQSTISQIDN
jgi:hypothetical protein